MKKLSIYCDETICPKSDGGKIGVNTLNDASKSGRLISLDPAAVVEPVVELTQRKAINMQLEELGGRERRKGKQSNKKKYTCILRRRRDRDEDRNDAGFIRRCSRGSRHGQTRPRPSGGGSLICKVT